MTGAGGGEGGTEGRTRADFRILVVDDDPSILGLVEDRLTDAGYTVTSASNGLMALEVLAERPHHLVVLDVMMPEMSGWEVARAIRTSAEFGDVKVIMLTAIGASLSEMTAPLYEVDAHIDKPFNFADLDATIGRLLGV